MRLAWMVPLLLCGAVGCGGLVEFNRERRDHEPSFTADDFPEEEEEENPGGPTVEPFAPAGQQPGVSGPQSLAGRACGADGVVRDSIRVSEQEELDQLEGCERIAGDFTLRGFAGMDDTPLSSLRTVEGGLSVYGADEAPRVLEGFRSLEQVGRLLLYGIGQLDLEPLGSLRNIGGLSASGDFEFPDNQAQRGLEISNCSGVTSLAGLGALEHVEHIELSSNPDLVSLAGLGNLRRVDGLSVLACPLLDLQGVEQLSVQSLSLISTALTSLDGLGQAPRLLDLMLSENAALASLEGGVFPPRMNAITIQGSEALPNLRGLEGLREVESLNVVSSNGLLSRLVSLRGLEGLEEVRYFILSDLASLPDLSGLDALRRVEQFQLSGVALRDLSGMPSLLQIDQLAVLGAPELTGLQGLGSVSIGWLSLFDVAFTSLGGLEQASIGNFDITSAPALVSLDGLPPLTTLGFLAISGSPALEDVQALAGLTAIEGLTLQDTGLTNLDALGNLRQLVSLVVMDNAALVQMDGLGAVVGLSDVWVRNNDALLHLPDFQGSSAGTGASVALLAQANSVEVSDNQVLTTLAGLGALRSVQALSIQDNPSLVSLDLSGLESASILFIRGNTSLDDEPFAPLQRLRNAQVKIVSNRSGPARLSPCPWRNDGVCDEAQADCAAGSDAADCSGL